MRKLLNRFSSDKSGQFSIMLCVALPMLMAAVGMATDLSEQQRIKYELQNATDAGVLAAADLSVQGASEVDIKARVKAYFIAACPLANCATSVSMTTTILSDRIRVEATAPAKTYFMGMMGKPILNAYAKSEMTIKSVPVFYEVHMVLDNSGSMNIVDGLANIRAFREKFKPWNSICAFACHTTNGSDTSSPNYAGYQGKTGAQIARSTNTPMREDRLRDTMIEQAKELITAGNATRVAVATYDFDWCVYQRIAPSTNYGQVKKSIETMPWQSNGTQHEYMSGELARLVGPSGTGASKASPKKAIVMITDGVSQPLSGSGLQNIPTSVCNKLKENGRQLFILNMVYPDPLEIGNEWYGNRANIIALRPTIESALQACASPGRYYRAEYGTSIDNAMDSIRDDVLKDAKSMYLAF